jgi:hypothetical protein
MFPIPAGLSAGTYQPVVSYDLTPDVYGMRRYVVNSSHVSFLFNSSCRNKKRVFVPRRFALWLKLKF